MQKQFVKGTAVIEKLRHIAEEAAECVIERSQHDLEERINRSGSKSVPSRKDRWEMQTYCLAFAAMMLSRRYGNPLSIVSLILKTLCRGLDNRLADYKIKDEMRGDEMRGPFFCDDVRWFVQLDEFGDMVAAFSANKDGCPTLRTMNHDIYERLRAVARNLPLVECGEGSGFTTVRPSSR